MASTFRVEGLLFSLVISSTINRVLSIVVLH